MVVLAVLWFHYLLPQFKGWNKNIPKAKDTSRVWLQLRCLWAWLTWSSSSWRWTCSLWQKQVLHWASDSVAKLSQWCWSSDSPKADWTYQVCLYFKSNLKWILFFQSDFWCLCVPAGGLSNSSSSVCTSLLPGNKEDEFRMPYLSHQQLPAGILPMVPEVAQAVGANQGHHTKEFSRAAPNPAKATVTAMIARELLYGGTSPTAETILKGNNSSGHVPHGPLTRPSEQLDYLSTVQGIQVNGQASSRADWASLTFALFKSFVVLLVGDEFWACWNLCDRFTLPMARTKFYIFLKAHFCTVLSPSSVLLWGLGSTKLKKHFLKIVLM